MVVLLASAPAGKAAVTTPPIGSDCGQTVPRQEVRDLTDDQWTRYIGAVKTLQQRTTPEAAAAYDELAFLHHKYVNGIHGAAAFFPWHRLFLRAYEHALQRIDPTVSIPYWDWTRDSRRLAAAPFWSDSLFGRNGTGRRSIVSDGQFADWRPRYSAKFSNGGRRFGLVRKWTDRTGLGLGPTRREIAVALRQSDNYDQLRDAIEFGPHGDVHGAIGGDGGDMNDIEFSPNDPVFWLHHAFVDKLWADWQNRKQSHLLSYGGSRSIAPGGAKLSDALPGFDGVKVRDVMRLSTLCVTYDDTTPRQPTITTLRTSSATVRPRDRVTFIATVSDADGGTVDFRQALGAGQQGAALCADVKPDYAVDTWTAACEVKASRLAGSPVRRTVVATYGGDRRNDASSGSVVQRIVSANPTVLWAPAASVPYGTPLGLNLNASASLPGKMRFSTLASAAVPQQGTVEGVEVTTGAPEVAVTRDTILDAGYHVLLLRFTPRNGPPQLLTRRFVVTRGTLSVRPNPQRITTQDPTPPLDYVIDGFVAGDGPGDLTGFMQPICRASRPDGASETAPRPAGTYVIFCEGGSSTNYDFLTSITATLEVVEPDDPTAGEPPEVIPPPVGAGGPGGRGRSLCSTFFARGAARLYCGDIRRRRQVERAVLVRRDEVVARVRPRKRGNLLELSPARGRRIPAGRYQLRLVSRTGRTREIPVRVIAPTRFRSASVAKSVSFGEPKTLAELCRLGNVNILLGERRVDGRVVTRWRVVQRPR